MYPSIVKINLNQSNKELKKICDKLGLPMSEALADRKSFDVVFYSESEYGFYSIFAYIRKGSSEIEFMKRYISSLKEMDFATDEYFDRVQEDSKKIKENLDYLLNKFDKEEEESKSKPKDSLDSILEEASTEPSKKDIRLTVDNILDKIDKSGLKSLTKKERSYLEEYSKKL